MKGAFKFLLVTALILSATAFVSTSVSARSDKEKSIHFIINESAGLPIVTFNKYESPVIFGYQVIEIPKREIAYPEIAEIIEQGLPYMVKPVANSPPGDKII